MNGVAVDSALDALRDVAGEPGGQLSIGCRPRRGVMSRGHRQTAVGWAVGRGGTGVRV